MKSNIAIAFIILISLTTAYCQQVTQEEAMLVAKAEILHTKGLVVNVVNIHQFDSNGHTLMYEVVSDRGINVLVSGNRLCLPVVGRYETTTSTSIFDRFDSLPCGLKIFIQSYKQQIEYSFRTREMASTHESEWNGLINQENIYSNRDIGNVEPLIKTHWRQGAVTGGCTPAVYNYYTPAGDTCDHCVAGCVAVAMGQVMNYWQWPILTLDNWQFDWCNMPVKLDPNSLNFIAERNAVARLLERCGKKAKMDYGCTDSESNVYKAKRALDKFNYDENSDHQWRILNRRTWIPHLRDNLDRGWPVIYGATGDIDININLFQNRVEIDAPSHAFVCDGYSSDGKFHFNWGLKEEYDGYYPVDSLCPNDNDYNLFNSALFDLRPGWETISYCDLSEPLDDFYYAYQLSNPDSNVALYEITPRVFKRLESASDLSPEEYRTVPSGAVAEYVAHKEIVLQPGFTAEYGSGFHAYIEPCANCEEIPMAMIQPSNQEDLSDTLSQRSKRTALEQPMLVPSVMKLYPNPTDNHLSISMGVNKLTYIEILDYLGRPNRNWKVISTEVDRINIDTSQLPQGVYIIRVEAMDGNTHVGRFIKS